MKLLVISARFPYPLDKGDKLRLYYQLIDLSKVFEITLICLNDEHIPTEHINHIKQYCVTIHIFQLKKIAILASAIKGFFKGWPLQVSYFFNRKIKSEIEKLIAKVNPDHIYSQLIRTTEYTKDIACAKTLDYMDCFSLNSYKRSITPQSKLKKLWKLESIRTKLYEKNIFPFFNNHTIISAADASNMPLEPNRLTIIPNGISDYFLSGDINTNRDIDILFVGNLSYYSNIDAVDFFLKECYPLLDSNLNIVIAGAHPVTTIQNAINDKKNVVLMANVQDIKAVYHRAKVFIAPITKGTGMQNKVLEALGCGCEVICSKEVMDGVAIQVPTLQIATTGAEYMVAINKVLSYFDQNLQNRMESKNCITEKFGWPLQNKKLIDLILKSHSSQE